MEIAYRRLSLLSLLLRGSFWGSPFSTTSGVFGGYYWSDIRYLLKCFENMNAPLKRAMCLGRKKTPQQETSLKSRERFSLYLFFLFSRFQKFNSFETRRLSRCYVVYREIIYQSKIYQARAFINHWKFSLLET